MFIYFDFSVGRIECVKVNRTDSEYKTTTKIVIANLWHTVLPQGDRRPGKQGKVMDDS